MTGIEDMAQSLGFGFEYNLSEVMSSEAGNDYHDTVRFPLLASNVSYSKCRTRV
jgi:hypothetical protein